MLSLLLPKHYRYYYRAPLPGKPLLWGFHGYGQLPEYFANRLEPFTARGWGLVLPEGPHRFYVNGQSGRVGASWMTREARLEDIEDQHTLLSALWERHRGEALRHWALGFSQGVPAFWRWYARAKPSMEHFIHYASTCPPELTAEDFNQNRGMRVSLVVHEEDEFIPMEETSKIKEDLLGWGFAITDYFPAGKHRVSPEALENILGISGE